MSASYQNDLKRPFPRYTFRSTNVPLSGVEITQIVQANPKRKSLGFFSNCDFITIFPYSDGVNDSQIILHSTAYGGLWFYDYQVFELTKAEWYAAPTGCPFVTILEAIKEN